jgi:hypothetical protein
MKIGLVRWVYRFFKPKRNTSNFSKVARRDDFPAKQLPTVGELFDQVKWQLPPANIPETILDVGKVARRDDFREDYLRTVRELFDQVRW